MEFPQNPTEKQIKKQQEISCIISGLQATIVDRVVEVEMMVDVSGVDEDGRGFNWKTFQTFVGDV